MTELEWTQMLNHFVDLGIAFLLAVPVAVNRELRSKGVGLRTFPLVSVASCGYMLLAMQVYSGSDAEARVMYGLITGIGFIGGGAILKNGGNVSGTATAASIWNTGAIGVSVAYSYYEIAITLSLINFLVLQFGGVIKQETKAVSQKHSDDEAGKPARSLNESD
ncbi:MULTISPECIES: MgtC/SapB family protein [unclassified Thalassolituus]|jgi:putative Mg2+ transporter-C (MgtC) family protein|uniref:MgtC/SapB family protein n=1 Tax=unclassified Thalassolituus TaxID=2624967 RepID=UPI000C112141|nr:MULTISPECIES: MgtC/SapB family protein [unclassified Thalassolituus]MBN56994.1 magnesium transporter MgtC [Oceanospirillaceae bacterium]MDQ4427641.1 MgtC/SapB family protein [Thalassolituus sp.]